MSAQMRTLLVGYDLVKPGKDYSRLIKHLEEYKTYWHNLDSTWFIRTTKSASAVRTELKSFVDTNDRLLVLDVTSDDWATYGFSKAASDWLQKFV